jgi:acyl-CoA dehydrogenase
MPRATRTTARSTSTRRCSADRRAGLLGPDVPEEYGGSGLGNLALCDRARGAQPRLRLDRRDAQRAQQPGVLADPQVRHRGAEARWLPKLATGECIGAYCLTEPNSGSDAAALATRARRDGDHFVLNGTKIWVTSGSLAGLARRLRAHQPRRAKAKGITAFLVDPTTPGVRVGKKEMKCGIRGSPAVEIVRQGVRVPAGNVLGSVDAASRSRWTRSTAAASASPARRSASRSACLEASIKYAKVREQFGQPIATSRRSSGRSPTCQTRIDAARILVHRAAWLRDSGRALRRARRPRPSCRQRRRRTSAPTSACRSTVAPATPTTSSERLFRDARITEIYEGATDIQRLVIARSLLA